MIISFNNNEAANNIIRRMHTNKAELQESLTRLATGSKVDRVTEESEVQRLTAVLTRYRAAKQNVNNAISMTQAQEGYMEGVASALMRMNELAMMANDQTKSQADRDAYNAEYSSLFKFVYEGKSKTWNGNNLFTDTTLKVGTGSEYTDTTDITGINLNHPFRNDLAPFSTVTTEADGLANVNWPPKSTADTGVSIETSDPNLFTFYQIARPKYEFDKNGAIATPGNDDYRDADNYTIVTGEPYYDISTIDGARFILSKLDTALSAIAERRAQVGAFQSALEGKSNFIDIAVENYEATRSRVNDVDIAEESTKMAKYNILMQSSTAVLAQANQINSSVLRLLS
jgi:flagellin